MRHFIFPALLALAACAGPRFAERATLPAIRSEWPAVRALALRGSQTIEPTCAAMDGAVLSGHGAPRLVLLAPVLGIQFDLAPQALGILMLSLLLGTPVLSLIGAIGAALTLGVRGGGVLLSLLVLPLYIPALIFGAGAVEAEMAGLGAGGHLSLLGAVLALGVFFAPWAATAALRIALE